MRPPMRRFGAKQLLAPRLIAMLPPHDHYLEVFAGSAAVLFAKPRSRMETLNDIDGEVVNLFNVLRSTPEALARAIALTPYARLEYVEAKVSTKEPVERARRMLVRSWQCMGNDRTGGWSNIATRTAINAAKVNRWVKLPDGLVECAERLRGVQIESSDWSTCSPRTSDIPPFACSLSTGRVRHDDTPPRTPVPLKDNRV